MKWGRDETDFDIEYDDYCCFDSGKKSDMKWGRDETDFDIEYDDYCYLALVTILIWSGEGMGQILTLNMTITVI